jgi:hypothetical protein
MATHHRRAAITELNTTIGLAYIASELMSKDGLRFCKDFNLLAPEFWRALSKARPPI